MMMMMIQNCIKINFAFSALPLMATRHKGHLAHKKLHIPNPLGQWSMQVGAIGYSPS